jgi:hypothetical protein
MMPHATHACPHTILAPRPLWHTPPPPPPPRCHRKAATTPTCTHRIMPGAQAKFITDPEVLAEAAEAAGLQGAREYLADESNGREAVVKALQQARSMAVSGVPYFVIDGRCDNGARPAAGHCSTKAGALLTGCQHQLLPNPCPDGSPDDVAALASQAQAGGRAAAGGVRQAVQHACRVMSCQRGLRAAAGNPAGSAGNPADATARLTSGVECQRRSPLYDSRPIDAASPLSR